MSRRARRLVYDTNVIVSAVLSPEGDCDRLLKRVVERDVILVVSAAILNEYERILTRDAVARLHQWTPDQIDALLVSISNHAMSVEPAEIPKVVAGDPTDDIFLAAARTAAAEIIVSGDRHLLALGAYEGIQILRPREMLLILQSHSRS
jgi:uncharacterized protein